MSATIRWKVSNWSDTPTRVEVLRETPKFFTIIRFGKEAREAKSTTYYHYFDTEDEAVSAIAARKAREEDKAAAAKVRYAAQDLLEAAQHALAALRANPHSPMTASEALLSRAIQKATGEKE